MSLGEKPGKYSTLLGFVGGNGPEVGQKMSPSVRSCFEYGIDRKIFMNQVAYVNSRPISSQRVVRTTLQTIPQFNLNQIKSINKYF